MQTSFEKPLSGRSLFFSDDSWKRELAAGLRTASQLAQAGLIPEEDTPRFEKLLARFPVLITPYYLGLIEPGNPHCPIRLQAIPDLREQDETPGLRADPLEDAAHRPAPRITHRYRNRALLHLTPNCSMVCRYCFRKSLLGEQKESFFEGEVETAIEYLETTPELEEVIFSGGDPFLAAEKTLERALDRLSRMTHIKRIRFHSRVPTTLPMRITPRFAELLASSTKPTAVVTHFNHPKELTEEAALALQTLKNAGISLLNQSVLLTRVNDDARILKVLSEKLYTGGVLPYYLHHPDRAVGTGHFDLPVERGIEIHTQLKTALPGYLVPRYVVDDPSYPFKRDVGLDARRTLV